MREVCQRLQSNESALFLSVVFDSRRARAIVLVELFLLAMSDSKISNQELPILDQLILAFEFLPTEANDIRTWAEDIAPAIAKGWLLVDGESSRGGPLIRGRKRAIRRPSNMPDRHRFDVVGGGEAEDAAVEGKLRLDGADDSFRLAKAVALAIEGQVGDGPGPWRPGPPP